MSTLRLSQNTLHTVFKNTCEEVKKQPCFIVDLIGILIPYYWMDKRWVLRLAFLFFNPSFFLKFFLWSSIVLSWVDLLRVSGLRLKLWHTLKLTPNLTEFRLHLARSPTIKTIKIIADIIWISHDFSCLIFWFS